MIAKSLLQSPARIHVEGEETSWQLDQNGPETWQARGVEVHLHPVTEAVQVELVAPQTPLKRIVISWKVAVESGWRFLGDHWERGYGDLEWRGIVPERVMPWYVVGYLGERCEAFGVKTGAAALAYWQVHSSGVQLVLDVRCGGQAVHLGERVLPVATIVAAEGQPGQTAFAAAQAFCARLCDQPRLPKQPVYGANDWYYRYGGSTHHSILEDARTTSDLSENVENRPYAVIDAGWQVGLRHETDLDSGDRTRGNNRFPDMPGLAAALKEIGVHPGIWVRPLIAPNNCPESLLLTPAQGAVYANLPMLDPSLPENLATVAEDIRRLKDWGYELIKHDFTTVDILGRWGLDMGAEVASGNWAFQDRTRTTAEVVRDLYQTIREAAGEVLIIGCNTIGHLGAGLFDLQRTGDDTSGKEWERTRKMGVNTLAFRMPQHGTFFSADADCVGLTRPIPWHLNAQWLDLLARSGTPLFVSAEPEALGPEQKKALTAAYHAASRVQPCAIPEDWLDTVCPMGWSIRGEPVRFDWFA